MIRRPNADFSLSGLKTAVRQAAEGRRASCGPRDVADLCASFQAAIVDIVEDRMRMGLKLFAQRLGRVAAGGGDRGRGGREHGAAGSADAPLRRGRAADGGAAARSSAPTTAP